MRRLWIFLLIGYAFLGLGCSGHANDPVISFKKPTYPPQVETENIQWGGTSEQNQELNDEI